jgi:outer membrane protein insertion porin family
LKELGEVKFTGKGIGKSKNEKLAKDNNLKPGTKSPKTWFQVLKPIFRKITLKKVLQMLKLPFRINKCKRSCFSRLDDQCRQRKKSRSIILSLKEIKSVTDSKLRKKLLKKPNKNVWYRRYFKIFKIH